MLDISVGSHPWGVNMWGCHVPPLSPLLPPVTPSDLAKCQQFFSSQWHCFMGLKLSFYCCEVWVVPLRGNRNNMGNYFLMLTHSFSSYLPLTMKYLLLRTGFGVECFLSSAFCVMCSFPTWWIIFPYLLIFPCFGSSCGCFVDYGTFCECVYFLLSEFFPSSVHGLA